MLSAIKYEGGRLLVLDQLRLPSETVFIPVKGVEDAFAAIKTMQVRGAPAIAIVGMLGLAVELQASSFGSLLELQHRVHQWLDYLVKSRPTAVNLSAASRIARKLVDDAAADGLPVEEAKMRIIEMAENMLSADIADNRAIGRHGADHILAHCGSGGSVTLLTHCNTGSLATAGYGTALGVARALHERGALQCIYCDETRPYNQGARLTAYELMQDKLPATLICDSMAAAAMMQKQIAAVVVGADRVVANGDTANKIGTYQLAIVAQYHRVPFYVCAPTTSIDLSLPNGSCIVIEERPHAEMTSIGGIATAPEGVSCWNPAFDVTPANLITGGIITEVGVFAPEELKDKLAAHLSASS